MGAHTAELDCATMAQQGEDLRSLLAKLLGAYHELDDRSLLHKEHLDKIFVILEANSDRITSQPPVLEKNDELAKLLREIDAALRQWSAWWQLKSPAAAAKSKKKSTMPSVSDCNPFKSRPEQQQQQHGGSSPPASVHPLLQRTIAILGDVPLASAGAGATTEMYEWTTSYVDETMIYGWDEEATQVADALVGGDDELFRAAGIVGIHGSGKTALAKKVFVHDKIKDAFPVRLWVCVGPPDHHDKACLLYRILDNLGISTSHVESIVDSADAVRMSESYMEMKRSKIGVLLFILHLSLHRMGHPYLIVFDDIRAHDVWYSNLTLPPPPEDVEWHHRLAYGLPKTRKSAVLVTCRMEDDARSMVRTGSVFRPPKLGADNGWKLFEREYIKAIEKKKKTKGEENLCKELEEMKEEIVRKCLGLPVAIIEAAKGFAIHEDDDHEQQQRPSTI